MWQLGDTVGRPVRLEIVDGDSAGAYAWLAVGEFSLTGLNESPVAANADALVQCLAIPIGRDARGERTATAFHARRRTELRELGERLPPRENARLIAACAAASGRDALATIASAAIAAERSDLLSWKLLDQDGKTEQLVTVSTELCKSLPAAPQQTFAKQLAQSRVGCEILAELLQSNFMPNAALRDIAEVLPSGVPDEIGAIIESGRESAKDSGATDAQIAVRVRRLSTEAVDLSVGKKMFTTHCANCHKLGGQGQLIGPQLDGAVSRSFERLAEDILAPNRNVDRAFRTSSLLLDDDSVVAGLVVESPGGRLEVTMQDGKKRTLSSESVVQRKDSETSLMPSNFSDVMDEQQLASVIRYLKSYQQNPQP
jgi:putative heme-binding domain-containing protein